ncbi:MAG: hypothetical protein NVS9B15_23210 [Acidobacteriaceae bacterium]
MVTTELGSACELITPDCGITFPPNSPDALANALQSAISGIRDQRWSRLAIKQRAQQLCDPERQTHALEDAFSVRGESDRKP